MSYTQLRLEPLVREEAEEMLTALLGNGADAQGLKQLILAKSEGNPFFLEGIVQALVDQGVLVRSPGGEAGLKSAPLTTPIAEIQLPRTVQGVLAACIDWLPGEDKALVQTLAVIGRGFSFGLLKRVVEQPEEELYRLLSHLQAGEFIYEQTAFPELEYTFKHAITQEVAYNSLVPEQRRLLHEHTAHAIEELFHDRPEEHYQELAHHYRRSGNTMKAVVYLAFGAIAPREPTWGRAWPLYNPEQHHSLAFGGGLDPSGRDHAALVLWLLGYPDQALERLQEVLTAVQKRPHPFSLAVALLFAAVLHQLRREAILAQERAEAAMTLSNQ